MIGKRLFLAAALLFLMLASLSFTLEIISLLLLRPILTVAFFFGSVFFGLLALAAGAIWFVMRII